MSKTAIIFTGQGAQSVGMGRDVAERFPRAAEVYDQASEILGYDIKALCFEGPAERLEQTDIQQPTIFTTSVAIWRAMYEGADLAEPPVAMAGLSLGEYTALHAAESVAFEDALRLVQRRGELMQAAARAVDSGMVSAMGLNDEQIESVCAEAGQVGMIVPANYNCPGQVVLSGEKQACVKAAELIEQAGGRAIPLQVAGAFHSPIMQPAADGLAEKLNGTTFFEPKVPVVANVNARYHEGPESIRQWLTEQLTQPVRWQASMEMLLAQGVERFIEVGPGRILTGLMRKISRRTPIINVSSADSIDQLSEQLAA